MSDDDDKGFEVDMEGWGCITLIIVVGICYIITKLVDAGVFN